MLVLDRKIGEGFWIGDRIYVKVLDIGRRRIKIGIQAPEEYSVVREELVERSAVPPNGHNGPAPTEQKQGTNRSVRR